ncbi:hypothetical protein AVEN_221676-1 [Araneus ventricosus]|uniref:Uncharacterized protein n=1 Tax=Araneus ventricosus TaxID=182803 RepID=A0A4Y2MQB3_ARAVE|nr:hypothetical protein AVEN_62110-1 [Araneus ventricosus]GBO43284.1 hypothetical protein AVEN_101322-1 [Araneus ventricosus]GBO43291.1 hypothetical protein AVEN_221676-1 [Araneus ventricosus]
MTHYGSVISRRKKIIFAGDLQLPTSPRVRSPPSMMSSTRKKTPSVLLLQPKGPLSYVTGSYVISLSNVLQSSGPDISSPHSKISSSTGIFTSA